MQNFRTKFIAVGALALSLGLGAMPAKAQEFINV
ncbi:MAG: C4-dicarboxylate ABC transporter, partial [Mesorhizobium sp.]